MMNVEYRRWGKNFVTGLISIILLGVFVGLNEYRAYRGKHQSIGPFASAEREKLPEDLEGKGIELAFHDFEGANAADSSQHIVSFGFHGKQSLKLTSHSPFSPGLWIRFKDLPASGSSWIRATGYVRFEGSTDSLKCNLVATCNQHGINYKYMFVPLEYENLQPGRWNQVAIDYRIPVAPDPDDVIQVYFWYRGNREMMVDEVCVNVY